MRHQLYLIVAIVAANCCSSNCAEDRWIWSEHNRQARVDRPQLYARIERDREPTTKRPIPGGPQNDEIEDYSDDTADDKNHGTRDYPFPPGGGYNGGQIAGGFNNYPGYGFNGNGGAANGILIGPGGPTGIIGRPQQYFPGSGSGVGGSGVFPGVLGQTGFPVQNGGGGIGAGFGNFPSTYPNTYGQGQGQIAQGQYPQAAQYPGGGYANGQYPGVQYPGGGQFQGNQFGGVGAQYPGIGGAQYPGGGQYTGGGVQYPGIGQYPNGGGPIYTEGYGLAYTNGYNPYNPYGIGNNGFGTGYDEASKSKRKLQIEGKSVSAESSNIVDSTVDDKLSKNLKKTT